MPVALDLAYAAAAAVTSPVWAARLLRTGKWRTDWAGRWGRVTPPLPPKGPGQRRLLIHAVSLGEVNLTRDLVRLLAERDPTLDIVISSTTNTGFARAEQLFTPARRVVRYPLDFSAMVGRFLDAVDPDVVALAENEVWPNFTAACARRGVALAVINGRLTARSHRRYAKLRPLVAPMYARLAAVAAQTPDYAARFVDLGTPSERVHVLDTMKWDTAQLADAAAVPGRDELAVALGLDRARPVIVLGSTGEDEERPLVDALQLSQHPDWQVVIVPRKPERFDAVAAQFPGIVRRTRTPLRNPAPGTGTPPLFLLDTLGELRAAYALADAVIVGRSFNGWGGSDPIEPVALGRPTVVGPDHANFADAVAALRAAGGLVVAPTPAAAAADVARLLADRPAADALAQRGRAVILSRQGATARHADLLLALLAAAGNRSAPRTPRP